MISYLSPNEKSTSVLVVVGWIWQKSMICVLLKCLKLEDSEISPIKEIGNLTRRQIRGTDDGHPLYLAFHFSARDSFRARQCSRGPHPEVSPPPSYSSCRRRTARSLARPIARKFRPSSLEVLCRCLRRALSSLARLRPRSLRSRPPCRLRLLSSPRSNPRRGTAGPPSLLRTQQPALSQARACDAASAASSPHRPSTTARLPGTSGRRRLPSTSLQHGAPRRQPQYSVRLRRAATCYPEALV